MKFTVHQADLFRAVSLLNTVVDKKQTIPVIGGILIQTNADAGTLTLQATNLERSMQTTCRADILEPGRVVIPAQKLYEILNTQPDGEIGVSVDETRYATITGKGTFKIAGLPLAEFPELPDALDGTRYVQQKADWRRLLTHTLFAVSHDESRYALTGVKCECAADGLQLVATDGHRLCLSTSGSMGVGLPSSECILPHGAAAELKKLCAGDGEIAVTVGEHQISFQDGDTVLMSRLIDAQFPDYRQVIPKDHTEPAVIELDAYRAALRRVALLSSDTRLVEHHLSAGTLRLKALDPNLGESAEPLEIENSRAVSTGFNAKYILDALNALDADQLDLMVSDSLSPGLLRAHGDDSALFVVMPMRLK